ncbi:MAG: riboflavin kinase [Candidatus Daviesbacteria bacterium]|nr:riboflavin kinase [Candidatus Daviesbacteria bacterium]
MYKFWGKVRRHNQRGKKLGFPTANISLTKNTPEGVYISKTKLGNTFYPSLTFIGRAKTFNEKKFHAETYILDFQQNIYGQWISVKLLKKIRDNKKFNSAEELVAQMKKDKQEARKYFEQYLAISGNI